MGFFYVVVLFALIDLLWWLAADTLARRTHRPRRWRAAAATTAGFAFLGLSLLLLARLLRLHVMIMPETCVIATYLWHFIIAPASLLVLTIGILIGRLPAKRAINVVQDATGQQLSDAIPVGRPALSRRDFLYGGLVTLPPLTAVAMTGQSKWTEDDLIRRDLDLPIPGLPPALDGLTIAHVTDPHLGSFITDRKVRKIIDYVNEMDADLVLQTGDLINNSLGDLPDGINLLRTFHSRYGVYSCQGNHDCIEDRDTFERDVKRAGLNLLVDETCVVPVRGGRVRLMGPRWWGRKEDVLAWSVNQLTPATPDGALGILMAHHPHAFDTAAAAGIPLTLAGHTHGGQVALSQNIGVGPVMYRYWSGVYTKGRSTAVVSNGTGNWFPLRINVPCEVLKLTLRRA